MEPIDQTVELAAELSDPDLGVDLLEHLQTTADRVQEVVPDVVGLSIAWNNHGVTFTLAATDEEIATLDAIQYLTGGPCVEAADREHGRGWTSHDVLNEDSWQTFAQATAARAVRSTLTFPLVHEGVVVGTANLYAASDHAFDGHHDRLALILGASTSGVVRNADLAFSTRRTAEESLSRLEDHDVIAHAVGMLAGALDLSTDQAHAHLHDAADRAGVTPLQLAHAVLAILGER